MKYLKSKNGPRADRVKVRDAVTEVGWARRFDSIM